MGTKIYGCNLSSPSSLLKLHMGEHRLQSRDLGSNTRPAVNSLCDLGQVAMYVLLIFASSPYKMVIMEPPTVRLLCGSHD